MISEYIIWSKIRFESPSCGGVRQGTEVLVSLLLKYEKISVYFLTEWGWVSGWKKK